MIPAVTDIAKRRAIEWEDALRYCTLVREGAGIYRWYLRRPPAGTRPDELAASIHALCAAARRLRNPDTVAAVREEIIRRVKSLDPFQVDWSRFAPKIDDRSIAKAAILKRRVGLHERGVIYIGFEAHWIKLLRHLDKSTLAKFEDRYSVVVAPSSNPHNVINYVFPTAFRRPVWSLINHAEDRETIAKVSANYRVVPLYTSHWVNPELFEPRPRSERDIDIIMVAGFGKVKRHHLLFQALRSMPKAVRAQIVGQDQDGRTEDTIRGMARSYGVADRVTLVANAKYQAVIASLCRARVSVLLSVNEGSSVIVSESLFADTPMAIFEHASNGSRAFINESTGVFLRESDLGGQLMRFLDTADSFAPRRWALDQISCFNSTATLNGLLKQHAIESGESWTEDIVPVCWCPDVRLARREDALRLATEWAEIRHRFGLEIGADPARESRR